MVFPHPSPISIFCASPYPLDFLFLPVSPVTQLHVFLWERYDKSVTTEEIQIYSNKQECSPVGCVPTAAVAATGCLSTRGVSTSTPLPVDHTPKDNILPKDHISRTTTHPKDHTPTP